jgi:glycosyltransferase involved in cell wall biosynthesis
MTGSPQRLVLCTPTYLRPKGLERLLDAVDHLEPADMIEVKMVVVDNDPEGSADWVRGRTVLGSPITYCHQPQRGISQARNRALEETERLEADWVGWLDDDEVPRPDWLRRIFATQRASDADVVIGPSEPIFEPSAKQWIIDTGAFEHERFPTGTRFPFFLARTSGVIIRASMVPSDWFDERLALTGGEDRLFFTRIHRAGGVFVWDDEAVVDEWIPTSRVSAKWLIRRWFRTGVTRSLILLYADNPGWPRRLRRVAGGCLTALTGIGQTIRALPKGRSATFMAGRRVLLGVGAAWGALGFTFQEYRTATHGS